MTTLEQRILQLEKQARFYRMGFLLVILTVGAFLFMSFDNNPKEQDLIRAKTIQVVDDYGNVLIDLKKGKVGNGEFNTYSKDGNRLVSLFTSEGGAGGINTFDTDGIPIFKITQTVSGGGYMALLNSDAKEIVEFGSTDAKSGYMRINDRDAKKLAWITYTSGGGGYFSLFNSGQETLRLSTADAGARVGLYNKHAKRVVFIGAQDNADGNITIYNSGGSRSGSIPAVY